MRRDIELIRSLLLEIEEKSSGNGAEIEIDESDRDARIVAEHLLLLSEGGFIDADRVPDRDDDDLWLYVPRRLTWRGHDFADAVRDPEIWARTKKGAEAVQSWGMETLLDLAKGFIKTKVKQHTGVEV